MTEILKV